LPQGVHTPCDRSKRQNQPLEEVAGEVRVGRNRLLRGCRGCVRRR
jgi:hypothetical protein